MLRDGQSSSSDTFSSLTSRNSRCNHTLIVQWSVSGLVLDEPLCLASRHNAQQGMGIVDHRLLRGLRRGLLSCSIKLLSVHIHWPITIKFVYSKFPVRCTFLTASNGLKCLDEHGSRIITCEGSSMFKPGTRPHVTSDRQCRQTAIANKNTTLSRHHIDERGKQTLQHGHHRVGSLTLVSIRLQSRDGVVRRLLLQEGRDGRLCALRELLQ